MSCISHVCSSHLLPYKGKTLCSTCCLNSWIYLYPFPVLKLQTSLREHSTSLGVLITRRRSRRSSCVFKHQFHVSAETATPLGAEVSAGPQPQITYLLHPPTPSTHRPTSRPAQSPPPSQPGRMIQTPSELQKQPRRENERNMDAFPALPPPPLVAMFPAEQRAFRVQRGRERERHVKRPVDEDVASSCHDRSASICSIPRRASLKRDTLGEMSGQFSSGGV